MADRDPKYADSRLRSRLCEFPQQTTATVHKSDLRSLLEERDQLKREQDVALERLEFSLNLNKVGIEKASQLEEENERLRAAVKRWEDEDIKQAACCNENEARIEAALAIAEKAGSQHSFRPIATVRAMIAALKGEGERMTIEEADSIADECLTHLNGENND